MNVFQSKAKRVPIAPINAIVGEIKLSNVCWEKVIISLMSIDSTSSLTPSNMATEKKKTSRGGFYTHMKSIGT